MARYGREWPVRGRPYRRGTAGRGGWAAEEPGYGWEYAERPEYRERPGYRRGAGYGAELGYDVERGYGAWTEYGEGRLGPQYPYDYEYGGRGWPYREAYRAERYGRMRRRVPYGEEYEWEMRRPEGFGMYYGYEYIRSGPPGYRRARGRAPGARWRGRAGRYEGRPEAVRWGYGGEYFDRAFAERYAERELQTAARRAEPRYGHTPPDRWPEEGHDLDQRPARERRMTDGEIHEAVLENLFQDSWVDPERIDVGVSNGVVTLSGEVRDFMEARYAWDDAWETAGVLGVINNLTVRADQPQEQMEMPQTSGASKGRAGGRSR